MPKSNNQEVVNAAEESDVDRQPEAVDSDMQTPEVTIDQEEAAAHEIKSPSRRERLLVTLGLLWQGQHHKNRKVTIAAVLIIIPLATIMVFALTDLNISKTSLANLQPARNLNSPATTQALTNSAENYTVNLKEPAGGAIKKFPLKDTGLQIDVGASLKKAQAARSEAPILTRLSFWRTETTPAIVKVDKAKLKAFIDGNVTKVAKPSQNATIGIDAGKVVTGAEVSGQGFTIPDAAQTLQTSIASLKPITHTIKATEIKPAIVQKDLEAVAQKVNTILAQKVTMTVNNVTLTATASDIGSWVELTPVEDHHTVDVTVDSGKVLAYLNKATKSYVTPPKAQITSTQPDGSSVILAQGQNGSDVPNKEAIAADIAKKVNAGTSAQVNLPVSYSPYKTINAQSYDKWLAVDVTTKRMYAYEKNNLVREFLVSAGAPKTPTVLGEYKIYSKYTQKTMRGANADGSRYTQPDVKFINYFYKDYAIHGNYWRPASYFGNINSSHGCVGIVDAQAEWIYHWAPIGTPVIVFN